MPQRSQPTWELEVSDREAGVLGASLQKGLTPGARAQDSSRLTWQEAEGGEGGKVLPGGSLPPSLATGVWERGR